MIKNSSIDIKYKKNNRYNTARYPIRQPIYLTWLIWVLSKEPYRAEGLHKILYHCPHCNTEHKMDSKGTELFCTDCGKRWTLNENGTLSANEGETEFTQVPDWFEWEREQVTAQVEREEYFFSDEVDVFSLFQECKERGHQNGIRHRGYIP